MLCFSQGNLLNSILPTLISFILRDTSRKNDVHNALRLRGKSHRTGHNNSTYLPSSAFFVLSDMGTHQLNTMCPDRRIFQRYHISHLAKLDLAAICGSRTMHKHIAFTGNTKHRRALLRPIDRIEPMFPSTTGMWIVRLLMNY